MDLSGLSSRAIIGRFYETLEKNNDNSWVLQVGMEFDSDQGSETYKFLGQTAKMREWIGGRQPQALRENGFTIENRKFESTLEISLDDIRRDKTKQIMLRVDEMADDAELNHWVELMTTLITTNGTCYDGQNFFSATHSEGASGTLKNLLTASEVTDLNASDPDAVTALEMANAIVGIVGYMQSFKDDKGRPINQNAASFLIMVPVKLWSPAQKAISQNLLSSGTGTLDNPLKGIQGMQFKLVANARLDASSTRKFYVFRLDGRAKPFILQTELPVETSMVAEGSEWEFTNDSWLFGAKAIRNVGFGMWQHAASGLFS